MSIKTLADKLSATRRTAELLESKLVIPLTEPEELLDPHVLYFHRCLEQKKLMERMDIPCNINSSSPSG